ncbi:UNVERIFIED_CONTAM: putative polyol transporter 4 [Sesamum radiatum]|uniref:Polyol transporter 4 n=1 Tax=Sesamum radiatum TaxID=300843 RepID=A0AAW2T1L9_SESRA
MLITGCGIQIFQQITGIDATVYYSPTIFKGAGIKGNTQLLAATVGVGFTKTIFILVAIFLIDKVGRKPLLYISTIGMTLSSRWGLADLLGCLVRNFPSEASSSSLCLWCCRKQKTKGKSLEEIEMLFQNDSHWTEAEVEIGDMKHLMEKQ